MTKELRFALQVLATADDLSRAFFRRGVESWAKEDSSPVSEADLEVEALFLKAVRTAFPADGWISEEAGTFVGKSGRTWVLDPIDGTSRFLAGDAAWGTHVALMQGGNVCLGAISRPALGRTIWAERNGGAWQDLGGGGRSPSRMRVSNIDDLGAARSNGLLEPGGKSARVLRSATQWDDASNDFAVEALASGSVDVLIDDAGRIWDQAPAVIIVEEAGGRFSDRAGYGAVDSGYGVYSNGLLHEPLLRLVTGVES